MMVVVLSLQAQTYTFTTTQDTIIDTGTSSHVLAVTKAHTSGIIGVTVTKVSGTPAGTAVLQGSPTGVAASYRTISTDTLTVTNVATQYYQWKEVPTAYPYYRVLFTGSGTMRAIAAVKMYIKK